MDEEILNSDGSRNYQANILLDNVKRLQAENERLKRHKRELGNVLQAIKKDIEREKIIAKTYRQALQEIREYCEEQNLKADYTACEIIDKINKFIGE